MPTFEDKSRTLRLLCLKVESLKLDGDGGPVRTREGCPADLGGLAARPRVNIARPPVTGESRINSGGLWASAGTAIKALSLWLSLPPSLPLPLSSFSLCPSPRLFLFFSHLSSSPSLSPFLPFSPSPSSRSLSPSLCLFHSLSHLSLPHSPFLSPLSPFLISLSPSLSPSLPLSLSSCPPLPLLLALSHSFSLFFLPALKKSSSGLLFSVSPIVRSLPGL